MYGVSLWVHNLIYILHLPLSRCMWYHIMIVVKRFYPIALFPMGAQGSCFLYQSLHSVKKSLRWKYKGKISLILKYHPNHTLDYDSSSFCFMEMERLQFLIPACITCFWHPSPHMAKEPETQTIAKVAGPRSTTEEKVVGPVIYVYIKLLDVIRI